MKKKFLLFIFIILLFIAGETLMSDHSLEKDYEILLVKLTSGENLISYVDTQDPDKIELYRPIEIRLTMNGYTTLHILSIWMLFSENETFLVDRKHVVMLESPLISVQKGYTQSAYSNYSSRDFSDDEEESEEEYYDDYEGEEIQPELKGNNRKVFEAMMELASNNSIKIQ